MQELLNQIANFNIEEFQKHLKDLELICKNNDSLEVEKMITRIVPTFNHQNNTIQKK